jgi:hypothetical protein
MRLLRQSVGLNQFDPYIRRPSGHVNCAFQLGKSHLCGNPVASEAPARPSRLRVDRFAFPSCFVYIDSFRNRYSFFILPIITGSGIILAYCPASDSTWRPIREAPLCHCYNVLFGKFLKSKSRDTDILRRIREVIFVQFLTQ